MIKTFKRFILAFGVFGILLFLFTNFVLHGFDLRETLNTTYNANIQGNKNIVTTNLFEIELPRSWIHYYSGVGMCAGMYGGFFTPKGIVRYSVDEFAMNYADLDSIWVFQVLSDTTDQLLVHSGLDEDGSKIGMSIYDKRRDMSLTFDMSRSVKKNHKNILEGLNNFELFVGGSNLYKIEQIE